MSDVAEPAATPSAHLPQDGMLKLAVGAIGVVYGDIGTSPLYAIQAIMTGAHPLPIDIQF